MKNIIVCIKQVLDPEIPLSLFKIDTETKQAIPPKAMPPVLSPFDENALEAALKIKDAQGANVTVISLGKKLNLGMILNKRDDSWDAFNIDGWGGNNVGVQSPIVPFKGLIGYHIPMIYTTGL